jgi:RND family efflux transporter MFP subunit
MKPLMDVGLPMYRFTLISQFLKTSPRKLFLAMVAGGLLSISCLTLSQSLETDGQSKDKLVNVTHKTFESMVFYPSRNAPAKVEVLNQTQISAQIDAILIQFDRLVGEKFSKGDVLAKLDCRDANLNLTNHRAQLTRFEQQLNFAKRQLERGEELARKSSLGEADLDQLQTDVSIAESQRVSQLSNMKTAALSKERCNIIAPYKGIVVSRLANVGELLAPGKPVLEIIQLSNVEVSANISLSDSQSFLNGADFYFEKGGKQFPLANRTFLPIVLNESRSREARLTFTGEAAIAGATGRLIWSSATPHLPANLLQQRNGIRGVFVVNAGRAKFVAIETAQEGRPILVPDVDSWQGAKIILDGRHGLNDGQPISIDSGELQ